MDAGQIGHRLPPEPAPREDADRERGIYGKYSVERIEGTPGKHDECFYYVLDTVHDPFAAPALAAYAAACEAEYPALAADIRNLPGVSMFAPSSATIADVQAVAEKLELVYVPEQHRLHAHPKEECNIDASYTAQKISEARLYAVSPDVNLCKHCVSPEEARIIQAGIRRA